MVNAVSAKAAKANGHCVKETNPTRSRSAGDEVALMNSSRELCSDRTTTIRRYRTAMVNLWDEMSGPLTPIGDKSALSQPQTVPS